jgi:hypothetical protein
MTIAVITSEQAIQRIGKSLRLPESDLSDELTPGIIAQALRRAAQILAPCAPHVLEHAVRQSLTGFGVIDDDLATRVEITLEALIVWGDILEMRAAEDDDWSASRFVLRPAPPSFVRRNNGSIVILGVAGDEITPFTGDMEARLVHSGVLRILKQIEGYDIPTYLLEIGLIELPERIWLRVPKSEDPRKHIEFWHSELAKEPLSGLIEGIRILDSTRAPSFYTGRWREPDRQNNGVYVARRPQRYGPELWCLVELQEGKPKRFLDLVARGDRLRSCDIAWRIQMAIDYCMGAPQRFRCRALVDGFALDFFSPLPSWAERHLALVGDKLKGDRCLFSYKVPSEALCSESSFLSEVLWVEQDNPVECR